MALPRLSRTNRFAFPGMAPRLNTKHLAFNSGVRLASVASLSGVYDLAHSLPATIGAAFLFLATRGGPGVAFSGGSAGVTFPQLVASESFGSGATFNLTMAAIFSAATNIGAKGLVSPIASGNWSLNLNGMQPTLTLNGGNVSLSPTLPLVVAGHTYFFGFSSSGTHAIAVLADMQTGIVSIATATTGSFSLTTTGLYGSPPALGGSAPSALHAAYISKTSLSLPQLLKWARDPWALWYDNNARMNNVLATVATAIRNLPLPVYDTIDAQTRTAILNAIATSLSLPTRQTYDEQSLTATINALAEQLNIPTVDTADEQTLTALINRLLLAA